MPKELPDLDDFPTSEVRLLDPTIRGKFYFSVCSELNVCSPPICILKPNPQGDDIGQWGLWEVLRS